METEIIQLALIDLPRLEELVKASKGLFDSDYYSQALERSSIETFIIQLNGQDKGWCLLNFKPKYTLYARLDAPEIQDINIHPSGRRQGLATQLISHCENRARGKNKTHMGISFGLPATYGPAQVLYTKLGYMPDGAGLMSDRKPVKQGELVLADDDLCLMLLKDLTPL